MSKFRVLPYRQGSKGAKAIASALGGKVLKLYGSNYSPAPDDVVINWGNTGGNTTSTIGFWGGTLNKTNVIKQASNKLLFFGLMKAEGCEDVIPPFWTSKEAIPDGAFPIVCRTVLAGHSGDGIVIAGTRNDLVSARLYVKYVKKQDEYRIHLGRRNWQTVTISVQRKAKRTDAEVVNWQVRNHQNGFVYVRQNVNPPPVALDAARRAFEVSGLDFGAVDVIFNAQAGKAYVLEINTAPGLEGTTVEDYVKFFKDE